MRAAAMAAAPLPPRRSPRLAGASAGGLGGASAATRAVGRGPGGGAGGALTPHKPCAAWARYDPLLQAARPLSAADGTQAGMTSSFTLDASDVPVNQRPGAVGAAFSQLRAKAPTAALVAGGGADFALPRHLVDCQSLGDCAALRTLASTMGCVPIVLSDGASAVVRLHEMRVASHGFTLVEFVGTIPAALRVCGLSPLLLQACGWTDADVVAEFLSRVSIPGTTDSFVCARKVTAIVRGDAPAGLCPPPGLAADIELSLIHI